MPTCSKCKKELPADDFYKRKSRPDRVSQPCKTCWGIRVKEWQERNPEKARERVERWQREHPERMKEIKAAYRERNPDQLREWYKKNKEAHKLNQRAWVKKLRLEMIEAYGGKCECCGEWRYEFLTLEHKNGDGAEHRRKEVSNIKIIRKLRDEGWPKDRFTVLCMNCNSAKFWHDICPHERERQDGLHSGSDSING